MTSQPANPLRILIVEDHKVSQMIVTALLTKLGHQYLVTSSGFEALAALDCGESFDLILMDCQMPEMDGYEAAFAIRETRKMTIPIIAMTANVMPGDKEKCIACGMTEYLVKPLDLKTLQDMIEKVTLRPTIAVA